MEYQLISRDEEFIPVIERFREAGTPLAIDFEEECNLHIYGEHLCIVQVFDGKDYFIIDTRSMDVTKKTLEEFFSLDNEKLWFECKSDISLLYRQYGIKVKNITDIRVYAKALGFQYGLGKLKEAYLGIADNGEKKRHQQANWLKRPISEENIKYALEDVEYLFQLRDVLLKEVEEKHLVKATKEAMSHVATIAPQKPGWTKICNTKLLSREEKIFLKNIFEARERIAKRFNTPAVNVLEKKEIVRLSKNVPDSKEALGYELKYAPARYRKLVIDEIWKAIERSYTEIRKVVSK